MNTATTTERKYCCVCNRQIVRRNVSDDKMVGIGSGVILMGLGKVCCNECAQDLDENGMFPEEG